MTRFQRRMLLLALAVCASATTTFSSPAQPLMEEMSDCSRWRIYKFQKDGSVNCGCRCGFTDMFCCS